MAYASPEEVLMEREWRLWSYPATTFSSLRSSTANSKAAPAGPHLNTLFSSKLASTRSWVSQNSIRPKSIGEMKRSFPENIFKMKWALVTKRGRSLTPALCRTLLFSFILRGDRALSFQTSAKERCIQCQGKSEIL